MGVVGDAQKIERRGVNGITISIVNRAVHRGEAEGDIGVPMEVAVKKFVLFSSDLGDGTDVFGWSGFLFFAMIDGNGF